MPGFETLAPTDARLTWKGLAALTPERGGWWQPRRLDPAALAAAMAPRLVERAAMPAGARLAVRTDAAALRLHIDAEPKCAPWTSWSTASAPVALRPPTPGGLF